MRYQVKLTKSARMDLQNLICTESNIPEVKRCIRRIREMIVSLEEMPEKYPLLSEACLKKREYRLIKMNMEHIFYRINYEKQQIYISRIITLKNNKLCDK